MSTRKSDVGLEDVAPRLNKFDAWEFFPHSKIYLSRLNRNG
jgi:hypothetical protein